MQLTRDKICSLIKTLGCILGSVDSVNPLCHEFQQMGVSEKRVPNSVPNGFADHYPVFKWL
jgi:hypothetical protein